MQSLLSIIDALIAAVPGIIAIDGHCGAGKTTLAARLSEHYDSVNVFHMDDFFLQPHMRTAERLSTPDGNVDYERFLAEVLLPLTKRAPFSYFQYDCKRDQLTPVAVQPKQLSIVEGVYSLHPALRDYYDVKVFLDIDEDHQAKRILARNTPEMASRFFNEWIPLEEKYFRSMDIRDAADFLLGIAEQ